MPVSPQPENPPEPSEALVGGAPSRAADDVVIIGAGPGRPHRRVRTGPLGQGLHRPGGRRRGGRYISHDRTRRLAVRHRRAPLLHQSQGGRGVLARDPPGGGLHAPAPAVAYLLPGKVLRLPAQAVQCPAQPGLGGVGALRRLLRLGSRPPAQGPGHFRGLGGGEVRVEALPALLQDLYREGVGLPRLAAPSRLGCATHQEPQPLQCCQERPFPEKRPARHHHPYRPVRVPAPRPGHDVGALPGQGRSGGLEGAHEGRRQPRPSRRRSCRRRQFGDRRRGHRAPGQRGHLLYADFGAGKGAGPSASCGRSWPPPTTSITGTT